MNHYHLSVAERICRVTIAMPKRGDGVSMHQHDEAGAHTTKVLAGSVLAYGPGKAWAKLICAGETYDFSADEQHHEISALEDGTVILNTTKEPMPEGLEIDEAGTDETPLTMTPE